MLGQSGMGATLAVGRGETELATLLWMLGSVSGASLAPAVARHKAVLARMQSEFVHLRALWGTPQPPLACALLLHLPTCTRYCTSLHKRQGVGGRS